MQKEILDLKARSIPRAPLVFEDLDLMDYRTVEARQMELIESVRAGSISETVIFCCHPPIVTLGRRSNIDEIGEWRGDILEVSRGGRATYHGPSQVVIYPILNLKLRSLGVRDYVKKLESIIVQTLNIFNIDAEGRTNIGATGVWVGEQKIASIGVAVRHWVSYHGIALNIEREPAFAHIKPCGFDASVMTSIEELLKEKVNRSEVIDNLRRQFTLAL